MTLRKTGVIGKDTPCEHGVPLRNKCSRCQTRRPAEETETDKLIKVITDDEPVPNEQHDG